MKLLLIQVELAIAVLIWNGFNSSKQVKHPMRSSQPHAAGQPSLSLRTDTWSFNKSRSRSLKSTVCEHLSLQALKTVLLYVSLKVGLKIFWKL